MQLAEQDLIIRVTQAYFDVLAALDTAQLTRVSKTAILEQLASAKRNFEVGTATITDTREAQARADLATAQEIAADIDLRNRRIVLGTLVGRRDVEPQLLVVAGGAADRSCRTTSTNGSAPPTRVHPAVTRAQVALRHRPARDRQGRGRLPADRRCRGHGRRATTPAGDSIIPGTTRTGTVGVELNWPLYTGGFVQQPHQGNGGARTALARRTRQRAAHRGTEHARRLLQRCSPARRWSRRWRRPSRRASCRWKPPQLGYKVGVRVNIDVLNAQTQLFQTQRDLFRSRYDVLVGSLRLRQASGQLAPLDLLSVEQPAQALRRPAPVCGDSIFMRGRPSAALRISTAMRCAAPR